MKLKISSKLIVMVLCAFILVGSIGLYAGLFDGVYDQCDRYCKDKFPKASDSVEYFACFNGCLFGANL